MNYINEADFAKSLTMANTKFVGRVVSYQIDLNEPTTSLYKLIMKHSNSSIPEEIIDKFEFTFNPPKTLNTLNMSDILNNTDQVISYMIKIITGENSDQTAESNRMKDLIYKNLAKTHLPMLDWAAAEKSVEDARIEYTKEIMDKRVSGEDTENQ